jgi:hypothetical protein
MNGRFDPEECQLFKPDPFLPDDMINRPLILDASLPGHARSKRETG